jgi:hypothetical protein
MKSVFPAHQLAGGVYMVYLMQGQKQLAVQKLLITH